MGWASQRNSSREPARGAGCRSTLAVTPHAELRRRDARHSQIGAPRSGNIAVDSVVSRVVTMIELNRLRPRIELTRRVRRPHEHHRCRHGRRNRPEPDERSRREQGVGPAWKECRHCSCVALRRARRGNFPVLGAPSRAGRIVAKHRECQRTASPLFGLIQLQAAPRGDKSTHRLRRDPEIDGARRAIRVGFRGRRQRPRRPRPPEILGEAERALFFRWASVARSCQQGECDKTPDLVPRGSLRDRSPCRLRRASFARGSKSSLGQPFSRLPHPSS